MIRTLIALALPLLMLAIPDAATLAQDSQQPRFAACGSGPRVTCVVDGDTLWLDGAKIRLADINTPETSQPACPVEAALGARATRRLIELLNLGAFTLESQGRDMDRYGRLLRVITRDGTSLGGQLVAEGLAEPWQGRRSSWCGPAAPTR